MNASPAYRPDIDGLRAVAVASVVAFHAFPEWVPGGFVGVDVFFVISGYLISTIILRGLREGSFSYTDFYARRIKRIFPALAVVLLTTFLIGRWIAFPMEFRPIGSQIAGGAAFIANLQMLRDGRGYFDVAEFKPLLHLWSLGVEEQFYIAWPFLLATLFRGTHRLFAAIACLLAASFVLCIAWSESAPAAAFYSPIARFWELLAGAQLSYSKVFATQATAAWRAAIGRWKNTAAVIGIALLAVSLLSLDTALPFPGWRAVGPVVATVLLIASGPDAGVNSRVLAHPVFVWVGAISYPLYLWHWPLLSFLKLHLGELGPDWRLAAVAASVILAWATFEAIERPIRFGTHGPRAAIQLATVVTGIAALGVAMHLGLIEPVMDDKAAFVEHFENSPPSYRYIASHGIAAAYRLDCDFYDFLHGARRELIPPSCYRPSAPRNVMIWGDSHAQSLYHGLREALPPTVGILQVATSACRPAVRPISPDPFGTCNRSNEFAISVVRAARPDVVLLAQVRDHEATDWESLARVILSTGAKHVVLIGPVPQWKDDLHKIVARDFWNEMPREVSARLDRSVMRTNAALNAIHRPASSYELIDVINALCDAGGCPAYIGDDRVDGLITFDYGHLTRQGSEYVARRVIAPTIVRLLGNARGAAAALARR